jgi:hypothetical protein
LQERGHRDEPTHASSSVPAGGDAVPDAWPLGHSDIVIDLADERFPQG